MIRNGKMGTCLGRAFKKTDKKCRPTLAGAVENTRVNFAGNGREAFTTHYDFVPPLDTQRAVVFLQSRITEDEEVAKRDIFQHRACQMA